MWDLHRDVLRRSLDARGWAYLELGADMDRRRMREAMRAVADGLSRTEQQLHARGLAPTALTQFDQGETTPFHVDGGPDESVLILGYEPTPRVSVLRVACLPTCAAARGDSPRAFLAAFPRGIPADHASVRAHAAEVTIHSARWPIVVLCNSVADPGEGWLGVLHQAELAAEPRGERVVNTVHLGACSIADASAPAASRAWDEWIADAGNAPVLSPVAQGDALATPLDRRGGHAAARRRAARRHQRA